MKLHLLHGPAIQSSRNKLVELRKKFPQASVSIFEKGSELESILTALSAQSLFEEERLIILENPLEDLACHLSLVTCHLSLILWFDYQLSDKKPVLDWVKKSNGQILFFPEAKEVSVFPFLDYLAAADKKAFLEIEKLKRGGFDIHYFITMTFYLLRNLINSPKNAPQFIKDKLSRQRRNIPKDKIAALYKDILEIDFNLKGGLLTNSQAEFLLVRKFLPI